MIIKLRPATPTDLDLLRHWDEQPHVIASDPNDDWHWEEELDRTPDFTVEHRIRAADGTYR
jgi:aminoglycoside 6'-N-acetyltransferase